MEAMGDELDRAEALGLLGVVLHPGCYTAGSEADGLTLIADALLELLRARRRGKTMVLLEHTAGQGTSLGATFEQLASIIAKMNDHRARRRLPRHLPSARVGLRPLLAGGLRVDVQAVRTPGRLRSAEGLSPERLEEAARQPRRSPRAHRRGHASASNRSAAWSTIARFRGLPMLLETPKAEGKATGPIAIDPLDEQNLNALRGLIATDKGHR